MFDLLMSADMMLEDPDGMAELLNEKLGIHKHDNWRQAFDNHPYIAHFLRVHKSLAVSPTRIEPQWHLDAPNPGDPMFHDFLESLKDYQGRHRPMMTHAVVITLPQDKFSAFIDKLMRRKLPFRMAQRTPEMPFDRLWLGTTPENPSYSPEVDGGLCIEVMGTEPLQMPAEVFADTPTLPRDPKPADMVRVTARGFLVRDLDDVLWRLSTNLDWEPESIEQFNDEGYRRARMPFRAVSSASLDIIQPTRWDGEAGLYLNNWGPGLYYIRISVNNLEAKAEDLRARNVTFSWIESSESVGGKPLLRVDPAELRGQLIEFEEA
ncbi:lactoylglutathione lyase [Spongiibacter sp. KMU-166]|uniref:Lactoylglutathione lyase n=1 Tax=Spongiibacter thalassae TaxID=2721624 RepID=A0ABX1GDB7_9GAMM|nr:lactoylglutathione lyase [Spongiibacter thalassae]NKI16492.1 lactoylglutathione lyase [Spongiibacter thalassae]